VKVVATRADDSSGYYRIDAPAEHIHDPSIEIERTSYRYGLPLQVNRLTQQFVGIDLDADVLVLQRPMYRLMPDLIDHVQAKGIAVVVELDDDFHTAHPLNRAFQLNHPRVNSDHNWHHLAQCVKRADLVTVSTDQLARRYGGHGRVVVLRNYVPRHLLEVKRRSNGSTLGWAGTLTNHAVDLTATRGGIRDALDKHPGWRFLCVGGQGHIDEVAAQLDLNRARHQLDATDWKPLELHHLVVSTIDVGIVPLTETVFNQAKSWLKGLEYAALGIPFVASFLPEYDKLAAAFGIGLTAPSRARSWARALGRLMNDPEREVVGRHYRQIVEQRLLIEDNAWRWAEAWHHAWLHRRQQRAIHPNQRSTDGPSSNQRVVLRPDTG
jgi:glycosyltransferase involved in cell wall biosynthesis